MGLTVYLSGRSSLAYVHGALQHDERFGLVWFGLQFNPGPCAQWANALTTKMYPSPNSFVSEDSKESRLET